MPDDLSPPKVLRFKSVFISHSSKDEALALELVKIMEDQGCTCWISCRDILPGAKWDYEVLQGLKQAEAIILLLTKAANESDRVLDEVKHARTADKPVIVIRIGDVQPSELLSFWVSSQNYIQGSPSVASLEGLVSKILTGRAVPPPLVAPRRKRPAWVLPLVLAGLCAAAWAGWKFTRSGADSGKPGLAGDASITPTADGAHPWSLAPGKAKFTLLNADGTADLTDAPMPARQVTSSMLAPTGKAGLGQSIKFGHRLKSLSQGFKGPVTLHLYPLHARYSDEPPLDGRELVMDRSMIWKRVTVPEGEFIDVVATGYVPADREFKLNVVDNAVWTELFMGPEGFVPPGMHEFGIAMTQEKDVVYRSRIKVIVSDAFTLEEEDAKIRVLGPDGQPIEGRIIPAERIITEPGHNYTHGIGLSLKFQSKGETLAAPWHITYYLKAAQAPEVPGAGATMSVSFPLFHRPLPQGFTAFSSWQVGLTTAQVLAAGATDTVPGLRMFTGSADKPGILPPGIHELGLEVYANGVMVYRGILKVELK